MGHQGDQHRRIPTPEACPLPARFHPQRHQRKTTFSSTPGIHKGLIILLPLACCFHSTRLLEIHYLSQPIIPFRVLSLSPHTYAFLHSIIIAPSTPPVLFVLFFSHGQQLLSTLHLSIILLPSRLCVLKSCPQRC